MKTTDYDKIILQITKKILIMKKIKRFSLWKLFYTLNFIYQDKKINYSVH